MISRTYRDIAKKGSRDITQIMGNQMDKSMDNCIETGLL